MNSPESHSMPCSSGASLHCQAAGALHSNFYWTAPLWTAGGLVFGWNALAIMLQEQGFYTKNCGQSGDGEHVQATIIVWAGSG